MVCTNSAIAISLCLKSSFDTFFWGRGGKVRWSLPVSIADVACLVLFVKWVSCNGTRRAGDVLKDTVQDATHLWNSTAAFAHCDRLSFTCFGKLSRRERVVEVVAVYMFSIGLRKRPFATSWSQPSWGRHRASLELLLQLIAAASSISYWGILVRLLLIAAPLSRCWPESRHAARHEASRIHVL